MGLQMLAFLVLVRYLSPAQMGEWSFYFLIHTLIEKFQTSFIQNGMIRLIRREPDSEASILSAAWALQAGLTIVLALLVAATFPLLARYWEMPNLGPLALGYPLVAIGAAIFQMFQISHMGHDRFDRVRNGAVAQSLTWAIAVGVLGYFSPVADLVALQYLQIAAYGAGMLATRSVWPRVRPLGSWMRQLIQFGKYSTASSMGSMLYLKMDLLIIGYFCPPVAVGMYSVATRINNYMELPLNVVAQVSYPRLSATLKNQRLAPRLLQEPLSLMLAISLPAAVLVFILAPWIVEVLAGPAYREVATVLRVLATMGLIKPFGRVFGIVLDAAGWPRLNFRIMWLSLLLNILLNLALVPAYGYLGAGVATALATWLTIVAGQLALRRRIRLPVRAAFSGILPIYRHLLFQLPKRWSYGPGIR